MDISWDNMVDQDMGYTFSMHVSLGVVALRSYQTWLEESMVSLYFPMVSMAILAATRPTLCEDLRSSKPMSTSAKEVWISGELDG